MLESYGPDVYRHGSYAYNLACSEAVRAWCAVCAVLSYGLGSSRRTTKGNPGQVKDTDQATGALLDDLDQRGLLDETLIVWGGEFGRTIYSQGNLAKRIMVVTIIRGVSPPHGWCRYTGWPDVGYNG